MGGCAGAGKLIPELSRCAACRGGTLSTLEQDGGALGAEGREGPRAVKTGEGTVTNENETVEKKPVGKSRRRKSFALSCCSPILWF